MAIKKKAVAKGEEIKIEPAVPKSAWYEYIRPLYGIKWGATVTLVGYVGFYQSHSLGMLVAAGIVSLFTFIEWCELAYKDFKRRG